MLNPVHRYGTALASPASTVVLHCTPAEFAGVLALLRGTAVSGLGPRAATPAALTDGTGAAAFPLRNSSGHACGHSSLAGSAPAVMPPAPGNTNKSSSCSTSGGYSSSGRGAMDLFQPALEVLISHATEL